LDAFPNVHFEGQIERIQSVANQRNTRDPLKYFEGDVVLDIPPEFLEGLRPGLSVTVEIEVGQWEDVVVLPKTTVHLRGTDFVVFVKDRETFKELEIDILASDYGFYVVEGVAEGLSVSLQHPSEKRQLVLPDLNAPPASTRSPRFVDY
jgi:hypothetical protein